MKIANYLLSAFVILLISLCALQRMETERLEVKISEYKTELENKSVDYNDFVRQVQYEKAIDKLEEIEKADTLSFRQKFELVSTAVFYINGAHDNDIDVNWKKISDYVRRELNRRKKITTDVIIGDKLEVD